VRRSIIGLAAVIILAATISACCIYKAKLEERPPTYVSLHLVNVGFEYHVHGDSLNGSYQDLIEGNLALVNGSTAYISMGEDKTGIYLRATAFEVNGQTIDRQQEIKVTADRELTVKAIISNSPLKENINQLEMQGITPIEGHAPDRRRGFSHTLTYLKIDDPDDFAKLCNDKNIKTVIHFRGLIHTGWIWDPDYDFFYFIENEDIYYLQTNI
jgi:hypothetical protein